MAGLLYPIFATYVRAQDRFETSTRVTLDGMAYMDNATYNDKGQPMVLKWDREAHRVAAGNDRRIAGHR